MTEKEVASMFDRWNDSLKTGDAKTVSQNYLSDAVLLPTLSNKARLTDEERIDYFNQFLAKKPVGHIDSRTIRIGCNKAIDTGTYTFTFGDGSEAAARYTFTYAWDGQKWLISSHHSSAMPEG
ncbi:SgcJ/EcaC family oxidoreductase [Erwinia sp. CGal63]|uniref:SgcJ/EcaC family oxidoreductase n=1 Tax=Erwinia sp. CGal63 TaxID=2919889 RepID=UPI003FA55F92